MAVLTTSLRLTIRSFDRKDIQHSVDLWCDPETMRFMGGPRDRGTLLAHCEKILTDGDNGSIHAPDQFWTAVLTDTEEYIGDFGLIRKNVDGIVETELVYLVSKQHWNKGFATEGAQALSQYAFDVASLPRLVSL